MRKKNAIYFVIISLIFCVFLTPSVVNAAEKLGTCTYTLDDPSPSLALSDVDKLEISVTVYNDGSIKNGKVKVNGDSSTSSAIDSGTAIADRYYLGNTKIFKKDGAFYKGFKKYDDCPPLQLIHNVNTSQLSIYVDGGTNPDSYPSTIVKTKKTGGSTPSSEKTYCTKGPKKVSNSGHQITLKFYEVNGIKRVDITSSSGQADSIDYDKSTTIDNVMIRISSDAVSTYWSDKCKKAKLFFYSPGSMKENVIVQTSRPSDSENGSAGVNDAAYDDGEDPANSEADKYKDNSSLNDLNKKYDNCSQIIDMSEGKFGWLLQKILNYIKIAGPILVVLLSALDFIKAVASSDENVFKKAQSRLVIRLVAALALFLVPTLVQLLLSLINGITDPSCGLK